MTSCASQREVEFGRGVLLPQRRTLSSRNHGPVIWDDDSALSNDAMLGSCMEIAAAYLSPNRSYTFAPDKTVDSAPVAQAFLKAAQEAGVSNLGFTEAERPQ